MSLEGIPQFFGCLQLKVLPADGISITQIRNSADPKIYSFEDSSTWRPGGLKSGEPDAQLPGVIVQQWRCVCAAPETTARRWVEEDDVIECYDSSAESSTVGTVMEKNSGVEAVNQTAREDEDNIIHAHYDLEKASTPLEETVGIANAAKRERNRGAKQLDALMKELAVPLRTYKENFPNKKSLHPYERSLVELTLGDGNYEEVHI
ncbi:hypothetical protein PHJA_002557800 [Phtheirospermum japonicum]|uniref:NOG1 N-terminal helical domain-containing protein n=1 Tax=Phtheirospermum japonicum TaxID=374723 RepID=A0A830D2N0_9LAMI|nr:hypothetical protein PHJA_002557800 [Phtheirospermum japonicum]